jgi:CheW-like domain
MSVSKQVSEGVRGLRAAFDQSFAAAKEIHDVAYLDFLSIRIAPDVFALRLSEIAGLHAGSKLAPAPSLFPELLGITAFRGVLTPVYDLGALLGYRRRSGLRSTRSTRIYAQHQSRFRSRKSASALAARYGTGPHCCRFFICPR